MHGLSASERCMRESVEAGCMRERCRCGCLERCGKVKRHGSGNVQVRLVHIVTWLCDRQHAPLVDKCTRCGNSCATKVSATCGKQYMRGTHKRDSSCDLLVHGTSNERNEMQ